LVALLADDSPRADYSVELSADDSLPVDLADSAADDSAAPNSWCQDAHWVLAGCPDDFPADLQAVDSRAYRVWRSADFRADHFQADQVWRSADFQADHFQADQVWRSADFQAGCRDCLYSARQVSLAGPS
jgi:hypothetical protein